MVLDACLGTPQIDAGSEGDIERVSAVACAPRAEMADALQTAQLCFKGITNVFEEGLRLRVGVACVRGRRRSPPADAADFGPLYGGKESGCRISHLPGPVSVVMPGFKPVDRPRMMRSSGVSPFAMTRSPSGWTEPSVTSRICILPCPLRISAVQTVAAIQTRFQGTLADEDCLVWSTDRNPDADQHAREQQMIFVLQRRPRLDAAGVTVHEAVYEAQHAATGKSPLFACAAQRLRQNTFAFASGRARTRSR